MLLKKFKKAFTLLELIIGITVIGILAASSTGSYSGYKSMADKEQVKLDIQQVKNAVDNYYSANQKFPTVPISKQPSPDVKDSSGKVIFKGYSKVDVEGLVDQRYLQDIPKLDKDSYFAVNFNGVVSIEKGYSESVIVNGGSIIVEAQPNDMVKLDVYVGPNSSNITVFEADKNYTVSGGGTAITTKSPISEGGYDLYTGQIKISNKQGQKYLVVKIKYNDGKNVELRTSFQYALSSANVAGDIYWISTDNNIDQSTDEGKRINVKLNTTSEAIKVGTTIKLNWTNRELASGAAAIKYEIVKYYYHSTKGWVLAPDSPIITGSTEYIDKAVNSNTKYKYNIYAYTASRNSDGTNRKTLNSLEATDLKPDTYRDTISYIENMTRNDFNTAYNKEVSIRVGDIDDGVMKVTLYVAKVEKDVVSEYKAYKMNKTPDGTSTVIDGSKTIVTDVYSVPVEVQDDYMIYYIEVVDGRGTYAYCYMNPSLVKGTNETDTDFERRRQVVSYTLPTNIVDSSYTLTRGLIEIFKDTYIDTTKIDTANSSFHLYEGKVTLP